MVTNKCFKSNQNNSSKRSILNQCGRTQQQISAEQPQTLLWLKVVKVRVKQSTIKKQTNSETSSCFSFYFFLVSNDIITTQINTKRSLKPRVDTLNLKTMQCFRILQSTKIKCVKVYGRFRFCEISKKKSVLCRKFLVLLVKSTSEHS